MRVVFLIFAAFLGFATVPGVDGVYRFGRLGPRLTREDLAAISRTAGTPASPPWALFGSYSQVLPATWYVDAFLAPTVATDRIRRGPVRHLQCRPRRDDGPCLEWEALPNTDDYVQIADGPSFDGAVTIRRSSERPIQVDGNFSDEDLLSLVAYIRSKPAPTTAPNSVAIGVSGRRAAPRH